LCKTNPIWRGQRVLDACRAKQSQSAGGAQQWARGGKSAPPVSPGPNMRNEANLARTDRNGHAPLGLSVRNKANSSGAARKASAVRQRSYGQFAIHEVPAKQSQFTRIDGEGHGTPARRPALSDPRVNCAKRTQFAAGPGGTGPQGRGTRGQSCETNPIWRTKCVKRTQFGPAVERPPLPEAESCKTNPISAT
jgi:hypothetical protein